MEKTGGSRPKRERGVRGTPDGFSRSETKRMEDLLKDSKDDILDESFHQKLTEEFNRAPSRGPGRARNGPIQMEQVQDWFKKRKNSATDAAKSPISSEETVHVSDASLSNNAPESSSDMPTSKDNGEKSKELEELEFEARSARDMAWYDVATFLAHRILSTGEPEVRVRYNGFGAEEDEWVNVKNDIRERSIPLESSECQRVEVGDLVLCFQERSDQAMYFDAHVLDIERKTHDIRGCRCNFLIRYDHDQTEEKVTLRRLCRRPKY